MRRQALAAAASLCLAAPAAAQPALDNFDAVKASAEITNLIARSDLDAAVAMAARLMDGATAEKIKDALQIVRSLGQGQYADLVYARDLGRTEKDIIFKIDFAKAFLFIRYLYHVDNGAWRLIRINIKRENDEPFPKEWVHIYPK
jgi:hypothetical protein